MLLHGSEIDEPTRRSYVKSISQEADRLTELVNNLLDMSRLEAGALPLDPEECHLADIVGDAVTRIARQATERSQRIDVDVPLDLQEMYVDYELIGRVLQNLVSNAIKYSPDGSTVTIRAHHENPMGEVIVEVQDEGIGVSDEDQTRLFDRFFRVRSQTARSRPGAGLGLAICKAIVEAHGGRIWVKSKQGQGSTFSFSLPVTKETIEL
jgi:signal transduction histidine kinase